MGTRVVVYIQPVYAILTLYKLQCDSVICFSFITWIKKAEKFARVQMKDFLLEGR